MTIFQHSSSLGLLFLLLLLLVLLLATLASSTPEEEATQILIDWIVETGGIYNSKQSFLFGKNGGVVANKDILEGEVLLEVTWDSILGAANATPQVLNQQEELRAKNDLDEGDFFSAPPCRLMNVVHEEVQKQSSEFAPYLDYLSLPTNNNNNNNNLQIMPKIPAVWSHEGRDLLEDINDHGRLPPANIFCSMNHNLFGACVDDFEDELQTRIASTVAAHGSMGDYGILVPLLDNHHYHQVRNSEESLPDTFNSVVDILSGKWIRLEASRNIKAGEPILRPYDNYLDDSIQSPFMLMNSGIVDTVYYPKFFAFDIEIHDGVSFFVDVEVYQNEEGEFYASLDIDMVEEFFDEILDEASAYKETERFLAAQLHKLQRLKSVVMAANDHNIPTLEWEAAWKYHENLVQAMELALQLFEPTEGFQSCPGGQYASGESSCPVWDGFPDIPVDEIQSADMDLEFDETNPYGPSMDAYSMCNNEMQDEWENHVPPGPEEMFKSQYQEIRFFHDPSQENYNDMVMKLDRTTQQATSYRPHYHEFAVHFPARFLSEVKRVLFVGGGDSMVLHEVLKYPSLEKVVGLELDQYVLRNSFRYFHTQPHFDDRRVEWWFGDGAKSLLMLPKNYFQSFDLVVVDLSETVMSFQVTNQLSIFQTLALLLKPDGILLKNGEYYMETMSDYFDHTLQYFEYDVPYICDQGMVIGSNAIDFFNHTLKDHGVDLLVLESQEEINEKFDEFYRFTEYRKNNARKQGQCQDSDVDYDEEDVPNAGILMVVEMEGVKKDLKFVFNIETIVTDVLNSLRFSIESIIRNEATLIVVTKEGYLVFRLHPDRSYVGLDISLWANFELMEPTRDALVLGFGGSQEQTSSFRIVTGGMSGSPLLDRSKIGPRMVYSRNCESFAPPDGKPMDLKESGLKGSLGMVEENIVAAVICGSETEVCRSLEIIKKSSRIRQVLPIYTCESMSSKSAEFSPQLADKMTDCEVQVSKALSSSSSDKISLLVVDESAHVFMGKVLLSIFTSAWNRRRIFSPHRFVAIVQHNDDSWRRNLLVKIREKIVYKPMSFVDLLLQHKDEESRFSLLSMHDTQFFLHLKDTVDVFNKDYGGAATMVVDKVFDGIPPPLIGHFSPKKFRADAYDPAPAKEQQRTQQVLGRQSIVQFEIEQTNMDISLAVLQSALQMSSIGSDETVEFTVFDGKASGVGDGLVVIAFFPNAHVVLSWDGETHIDANLYSRDEDPKHFRRFVATFVSVLKSKTIKLKLTLSDTHPRGVGKVVSFPGHMN